LIGARNRQASQAEVLAYLRCHGIGATAQVVAPEIALGGDTLLAAGAEHEAGLLIMAPIPIAACARCFWAGHAPHP